MSYGGLGTLYDNDLSGDDHYRVQLWLDGPISTRVLKQRVARLNSDPTGWPSR
jgi:hypothetical protein